MRMQFSLGRNQVPDYTTAILPTTLKFVRFWLQYGNAYCIQVSPHVKQKISFVKCVVANLMQLAEDSRNPAPQETTLTLCFDISLYPTVCRAIRVIIGCGQSSRVAGCDECLRAIRQIAPIHTRCVCVFAIVCCGLTPQQVVCFYIKYVLVKNWLQFAIEIDKHIFKAA